MQWNTFNGKLNYNWNAQYNFLWHSVQLNDTQKYANFLLHGSLTLEKIPEYALRILKPSRVI